MSDPVTPPAARFGYAVFWVPDADAAARFYEAVFAFPRVRDMKTPVTRWIELDMGGPSLAFAELGEAMLLLGPDHRAHSAEAPPVASAISFVTGDVAGVLGRAKAEGAHLLQAAETQPWGQTIARFRDLNGAVVSLATPMVG